MLDSGLSVEDVKPGKHLHDWTQKDGKSFKACFASSVGKDGKGIALAGPGGTSYTSPEAMIPEDAAYAEKLLAEEKPWLALKEERSSSLYKLARSGAADTSFGKDGRVPLGASYYRAFAVDPKLGTIFIASGHEVQVFDAGGTKTGQSIGGWDNDPAGPKGLGWPHSLAISTINSRIYIANGTHPKSYGNGKVYDRTKPGFEGIISRIDLSRLPVIWVACHGPGFGP